MHSATKELLLSSTKMTPAKLATGSSCVTSTTRQLRKGASSNVKPLTRANRRVHYDSGMKKVNRQRANYTRTSVLKERRSIRSKPESELAVLGLRTKIQAISQAKKDSNILRAVLGLGV